MTILGIDNRTENWKTARYFAPLLLNSYARAELAWKLGEPKDTSGSEVKLELFWKGMRDYVDKVGQDREESFKTRCTERYKELFSPMRSKIEKFNEGPPRNRLRLVKGGNYDLSKEPGEKGLWDNLYNTEIDIVLETPNKLFIGEAKQESNLDATGSYVLVHQLIRQYVTAIILLDVMRCEKKVVPFLVVDKERRASILNTGQVGFMQSQGWLREENVLTWGDIRGLHP